MKLNITIIVISCAISLISSSAFAHQWCWTCNEENTYGWQLMTSDERKEHQAKLARFTDYNSCKEYIDSHNKEMKNRARGKGIDLQAMDVIPCDAMRDKGVLK